MTHLVACLGKDPATIAHLKEVIKRESWEKVLVISENRQNDFPSNVEFIIIDEKKFLRDLSEEIRIKLKEKINDIEVAVNMISGSGKSHMAVLSALLKLGLGIRLVALTKEGVKEI